MLMDKITYRDLTERCKQSAKYLLPDLPNENTLDAWESFRDALEKVQEDSYDLAWQEVDGWDWAIYTYQGFMVYDCLPSDEQRQAEESFFDIMGSEQISTLNDPYDMGARIGFFGMFNAMQSELCSQCDELLELAENQIENLES